MDAADVEGAEHICEISRDGRETAAIHGEDHHGRRVEADERRGATHGGPERDGEVERGAQNEEDVVGGLAPDEVRGGRPRRSGQPC